MSRWIDAGWLLNFFEPYTNDYQTPLGSLRACVDDAPSIDIVRCGECISADEKPIADGRYWCNNHGCYMRFCSDGEREGE